MFHRSLRVFILFCLLTPFSFREIYSESKNLRTLLPPKNGTVYVIAHRGYHKGYPENTLIAYKKAIELGVDFIEIDLRTTKDGAIVSVHNSKIDDYAEGYKGNISEFTLPQLKEIDIGSRVSPEFANERIPTLSEILELAKDRVGLYIDMKNAEPEKVLYILDKYDMRYKVVWYGGLTTLEKIKDLCSECFIMPDPGPLKHLEYILDKFNPPIISTDIKWCSEEFVKLCHQRNSLVFVDVLEDGAGPKEWEQVIGWGVDGIQTDDPDLLIEYLKSRRECNVVPK